LYYCRQGEIQHARSRNINETTHCKAKILFYSQFENWKLYKLTFFVYFFLIFYSCTSIIAKHNHPPYTEEEFKAKVQFQTIPENIKKDIESIFYEGLPNQEIFERSKLLCNAKQIPVTFTNPLSLLPTFL